MIERLRDWVMSQRIKLVERERTDARRLKNRLEKAASRPQHRPVKIELHFLVHADGRSIYQHWPDTGSAQMRRVDDIHIRSLVIEDFNRLRKLARAALADATPNGKP